MADLKPFAGLSQEETNFTMLQLLAAILDKLPRIDANDRAIVNINDGGAAITLASLATLTAAVDLNRINAFGATATTQRPADAMPIHIANFGAQHIYDNIKVT